MEQFKYYIDHQAELVEKYSGKFVVIKDCRIIGASDSEFEVVNMTSEQYELGTFLVRKCEPGNESYTQTYHSRVALA